MCHWISCSFCAREREGEGWSVPSSPQAGRETIIKPWNSIALQKVVEPFNISSRKFFAKLIKWINIHGLITEFVNKVEYRRFYLLLLCHYFFFKHTHKKDIVIHTKIHFARFFPCFDFFAFLCVRKFCPFDSLRIIGQKTLRILHFLIVKLIIVCVCDLFSIYLFFIYLFILFVYFILLIGETQYHKMPEFLINELSLSFFRRRKHCCLSQQKKIRLLLYMYIYKYNGIESASWSLFYFVLII